MLNLLIYEKNIYNCKKIVDAISNINFDVKIYSIIINIYDIETNINTSKSDIIILDIFDNDSLDINFILSIDWSKFNKTIIILTNNPEILKNNFRKNVIIISDINLLSNVIENLFSTIANNSLKSIITNELEFLCFNLNHIGTQYLIDVISIIYNNYSLINNLTKLVYPILSKKYLISINTLKCDIFQSTLYSYINCEEIKLENYLERSCIEKPSTKNYINAIIKHIKLGTLK